MFKDKRIIAASISGACVSMILSAPLSAAVVDGENSSDSPLSSSIVKVETTSVQGQEEKDSQKNVCTGTLVSPEWVLTAKHCVDSPNSISTVTFPASSPIDVDSSIVHDTWDAALLHVGSIPDGASPAPLWNSGTTNKPLVGKGYGFGGLSSDGSPEAKDSLRSAQGTLSPKKEKDTLFPSMISQRVTFTNGLVTKGDSGGGFFVDGKLYGILSQGVIIDGEREGSTATALYVPISTLGDWVKDSANIASAPSSSSPTPSQSSPRREHKPGNAKKSSGAHKSRSATPTQKPQKRKKTVSHAHAYARGGENVHYHSTPGGKAFAGDMSSPKAQSFFDKMMEKVNKKQSPSHN